jgi:FkbM family methyltransferase
MNLFRFLKKCKKAYDVVEQNAKASYAQAGEDLIIENLFNSLKIKNPTYLDIGTNQPKRGNNTFGFYSRGGNGVCIEPDQDMYDLIKRKRPNDRVLNIGIGIDDNKSAEFYLFPGALNAWSTFSKTEADIRKKESGVDYSIRHVNLCNINEIISEYFNPCPNFISLDVEGLDFEILQSINFKKYTPEVICVETITFSYLSNTEKKVNAINDFMLGKGYIVYADTHINTIFCRKNLFNFLID